MEDLKLQKLKRLTSSPGVYLMKDAQGKIIYVGKALNLRKRITSYFQKKDRVDKKTTVLVQKIADFDTILTRNEKEALILEATLIKRHRPRYNVILKDGKRYLSLRMDMRHPYPSLMLVRKIKKNDGAQYFGPYASAMSVHKTLKVINKTFKLRKCKPSEFRSRVRPCLHYQMGVCMGPCCLEVSHQQYQTAVEDVIAFLKGRTPELLERIRKEMVTAAKAEEFERAAVLRDKMRALEKTLEHQVVVSTDFGDRDIFAMIAGEGVTLITLLFVRAGNLLGTRHFQYNETYATPAEVLSTFIRQYYDKMPMIPAEILVSENLEDREALADYLSAAKGRKVNIRRPRRGEKMQLIKLAMENAVSSLKERLDKRRWELDLLSRLKHRLKMGRMPIRIECFDNSNIGGEAPVAARVVFENGRPQTDSYRRYKLSHLAAPDDYAHMREVLQRRFDPRKNNEGLPDLLMVDGGRGQLGIATSVLAELNLGKMMTVIGIAKKDSRRGELADKIYIPGRVNPVNLGAEDLLLFLQRIRDEAHRFAISFHRKYRGQEMLQSGLDQVPGIGLQRKRVLLQHYKGLPQIRKASLDELSGLPGMNASVAAKLRVMLNAKENV